MSDDSKNNNDNVDNNVNNPTSNQPSVKITDLTPNKGVLKGKKKQTFKTQSFGSSQ